jgi:acyl carrier protein
MKIKITVEEKLLRYFKNNFPALKKLKNIPKNTSLAELGYLDSFAIIDMVTFIETTWKIKIEDKDITSKKMGSINKMVDFINKKIN